MKRVDRMIQLRSGTYFDPFDPEPESILIEDIAHALSMLCRFNGHTCHFYSVAEHSCWVSHLVPPEHQLTALLHDATEAYIADVTRPVKQQLSGYKAIERDLWLAIAARFDLPSVLPDCVYQADRVLLATERRDLMTEQSDVWAALCNITPMAIRIDPVEPMVAKSMFLSLFNKYQHQRQHRAQVGAA